MALTFLLITVFIDMLGLGVLIPVIPFVVAEFSPTAFTVGALSMAFALFQFVAAPVLGALSDRYGRRPLLLFSLAGSGVGYVVFALAQSLPVLFVARIIDGMSGGNISIAQAALADLSSPAERSKTFGLLGASIGLGFILGPAIGGALSTAWGLKAPAIAAAALAFANTGFGWFALPESLPAARRRGGPLSFASLNPLASVVRGVTHPELGAILVAMFAFGVAFTGLQSNLAVFTRVRFGWGPGQNAVLFSLLGVMAAVSQAVLVRTVSARIGDHRTAVAGLAIQAVAYAGTSLTPAAWLLFALGALISLGVGITTPTLQGIVSRRVPDHAQGAMLGTTQAISALTRIAGPLWAGLSFDWLGPGAPYWSGAILILAAAALVARDATATATR